MREAFDAYNRTARITRSPRDLEASLLLKSAAQLQDIKENWGGEGAPLQSALLYNRRLWTVFVSSVARAENPLPIAIKNNIASLGAFIFHHSMMIERQPAPDKLNTLIMINREIAAGLHAAA